MQSMTIMSAALAAARMNLSMTILCAGIGFGMASAPCRADTVNERMAAKARAFLDSLTPDLRARAARPWDDAARTELSNIPGARTGITFADMTNEQRSAARELMRSALSSKGALKAEAVIAHEELLRDLEKSVGGSGATRDRLAYTFAVFGELPQGAFSKPWSWRVEGHHLSLNFTATAAETTSVTPMFFGANPAHVRSGPQAGMRILGAEEDFARDLLAALDDAQRAAAVLSPSVPAELLNAPGRARKIPDPVGTPSAGMTSAQRVLVERLVGEYVSNLCDELAVREMERFRSTGFEKVRFAWYGSTKPSQPHCYSIIGPTLSIEYDCSQDAGNHIHSVWHDRELDYGATPKLR